MKKICLPILLICLLPVLSLAATIVDSGTCGAQGDNLTWTLDSDGVLTISGTGAMTEFANSEAAPWYASSSSIQSVVTGTGVTSIGDYAFAFYYSLESVTIKGSINRIGKSAFRTCIKLKGVTIQGNKLQIGNFAFAGCSVLDSVMIEGSVSGIEEYAFSTCRVLKSVTISGSDVQIGNYAFYYSGLESLTITGSVSSVGESAFGSCSSLKNVTIPGSKLQVGSSAFNYSGLESVTITGSVSNIGESAFSSCTGLKSVTIPDYNVKIGNRAFDTCSSLESVTIEGSVSSIGEHAFDYCTSLKNMIIPGSDLQIGSYAFNQSGLESVTFSGSVSSIEKFAFMNCNSLKSVTISGSGLQIRKNAFTQSGIESVTITGSVSSIGESAFDNCAGLKSVAISGSDQQIGEKAFFYCKSLESVTITGSVSSIGELAFHWCKGLKSVTIPGSGLQIGKNAFTQSGIESVTITGSVSSIEESAFNGCEGLTNVIIPGNDLQIGKNAFSFSLTLESVTITGSVSSIEESAFNSCEGLTNVIIPGNDLQIGKNAFSFCSSLDNVRISGSVKSIGESAFSWCESLTSVIIPASMTNIGRKAFDVCSSLKDIYFCGTRVEWKAIPKESDWDSNTSGDKIIHVIAEVGTGKETDPYLIQTADHWDTLSIALDNGKDTAGKYFQLDTDDALPVSTMIGTEDNPFKGIFDGNGKTQTVSLSTEESYFCAPFSRIEGATIQNIHVTGTVNGAMHCSGLVGLAKGSNTIRNCKVAVEVKTTKSHCGGILGHGGSSATTIQGCVFSGSIAGATHAGTIWGWSDDESTPVLKDCLDWSDSPFSIGLGEPDPKSTVSNCYYKYPEKVAGEWRPWSEGNRGKLIRFVIPDAGVTLSSESGTEYGVSDITAFPAGMFYGDNLIAGAEDEVPLHPHCSIPEGKYARYYGNGKLLTVRGAGVTWMLTMPGEDVTISAEFSTIEPYGRPTFRLPAEIENIGEDAFEGIKAAVVYVPDTCKTIGAYAFRNCPNLRQIRLPKDCEINDAAFFGCSNLMAIYSSGDGTTRDWAVKNGYGFMKQ